MKVHELIARLARSNPEDRVHELIARLARSNPEDRVHELIARLARSNPEDNVVFDPDSQCLWIFNTRLGMFQPLDKLEVLELTQPDKQFLRAMHIQS